MVLSAVYSGLDAVPSHKGDDKRITQLLASLSRKLLQGRVCSQPWHDVRGHHRSWTNLQVLREVGLFTLLPLKGVLGDCCGGKILSKGLTKMLRCWLAFLGSFLGRLLTARSCARLTQQCKPVVEELARKMPRRHGQRDFCYQEERHGDGGDPQFLVWRFAQGRRKGLKRDRAIEAPTSTSGSKRTYRGTLPTACPGSLRASTRTGRLGATERLAR